MKKLATLVLSLVLVMALTVTAFAGSGLDNFTKKNTYTPGQFSDVPATSSEWYVPSVKAAYEYGLIVGNADGTFGVSDNLTIAQTLALASRLNNIFGGGTGIFDQGEVWYQVYVDYCVAHNIIKENEYNNYNASATRAQFVQILSKSFPDSALQAINEVEYIPDVNETASYYADAIKLYRAGILTGSTGNKLLPNDNIKRSEVAAIITRMADTSLRQSVTLKKEVVDPQPVDDPDPIEDPTPKDIKVNTKAYDYLVKYIKNDKNTQSAEGVYLDFLLVDTDESQESGSAYMLIYSKEENAVSITSLHSNISGENEEFGCMLILDSKLTTPYAASFSLASGETNLFSGTTEINPATFKASLTDLDFYDVEGEFAGNKNYLTQFSTTMVQDLAVALYIVDEQVLKSGGFSLADLGFGDIEAEKLLNA